MRKPVLAFLGVLALGAGAMLLVYRLTLYQPAPVAAAAPPASVLPPDFVLPPPPSVQAPQQAEVRIPVAVGGKLQEQLESQDPEERKEALVEVREQRRANAMDWLNRNSARRAAAAKRR